MQIVILSGGSGKRLWPLSNDVRSKQFIRILKNGDNYESMVERIHRFVKKCIPDAGLTVATSKSQVSSLINQLGEDINICVEPSRRDTFPAVTLAASYLHDVCKIDDDEPIVVCPVDPYVEEGYFETLRRIGDRVSQTDKGLVLMGIKPTYPSEKYGYILTDSGKVTGFKEKPDKDTAEKYISEGALWNGGVFGFKLKYILDRAHELIDFKDYDDLNANYDKVTKISFDYAVVEQETNIYEVTYDGDWKDIGTWNTLTEVMGDASIGNAIVANSCVNTNVINELDIPVLAIGLKDAVVVASPDGILVSDKGESSYMKGYVDEITGPVMYAEKSWGSYKVIDAGASSLTIKVTLLPGHEMNYHSHKLRDEVWTVTSGEGTATLDGKNQDVKPGDVIKIPAGCIHKIYAKTNLVLIEVQTGENISASDKIKA